MNLTIRMQLLGALAVLTACGSGAPATPGDPAATPNLTLRGAVTARAVGQVEVAGVTVTTPATARIDGASRPAAELQPGMTVRVKAHGSGRQVEGLEIEAEHALKGSVVSTGADDLVVGGQVVRVDDSTEFEHPAERLGAVAAGQRVRIFGVPDDRGGLRATRVESTDDTTHELELKGWVSGLTATGFTLGLSPDSTAAGRFSVTLVSGVVLPAGLRDGAFVEVRSASAIQPGHAILATGVELEDGRAGDAGQESEVEGIVTSGTSAQFVVAGTTVTTAATTRWDGGLPADLAVGLKVEAEGVVGADGVLAAEVVSFRASARLIGPLTGKAGAGADATFTVNGVAVLGDGTTDWRTDGSALTDGDWIEVRGQADRSGSRLVASRVEVRSVGNGRPVVQGVVTAFDAAAGTVTILGATFAADGSTEFQGHQSASGVDGPALTRSAFFSALAAGFAVVKATGPGHADWSAGPVGPVRSLELQGER